MFGSLKPKPKASPQASQSKPAPSSASGAVANPYLNARREWDERYGHLLTQAKNWRLAALAAIAVAGFSVLGVTYIGGQSKIQPFVVAVDQFGSPIAVARPQALPAKRSEVEDRVVRAQIANFIFNARSLLPDQAAQQVLVDRTFSMISTSIVETMTRFQRDELLPKQKDGVQISVRVRSVIPAGQDTYQVDWTETIIDPGSSLKVEDWRALVTISVGGVDEKTLASNPELFYWNPLGVLVKSVNWQRVSS